MATIYNNPQQMTVMGSKTPKTVIYKSESHKLHQAFPVEMNGNKVKAEIIQGMPVMLNADGSIAPYAGTGNFLGIAMTDSITPAYPGAPAPEVTVAVEGYCIVYGLSRNNVDAGPVKPEAYDAESGDLYIHYATDSAEAHPKFLALNRVTEGDSLIQVLVR